MRGGRLHVLSLASSCARRHALAHIRLPDAETTSRAGLLILPPMGEEGNRARRFLSHLARLLVARGIASLLLDLSGSGESPLAAPPSRIESWFAEIDAAGRRLRELADLPDPPALFGMRHGGMVAAARCRARQQAMRRETLILFDAPPEPVGGREARVKRQLFPGSAPLSPLDAGARIALDDPGLVRFVEKIPAIRLPPDRSGDTHRPAGAPVHRLLSTGSLPPVWAQREALVPADLLSALAGWLEGVLEEQGQDGAKGEAR